MSISNQAKAAREFLVQWNQVHLNERIEAISGFKSRLESDRDRLANLLTEETGKPITQSENELTASLDRVQFFIDRVRSVLEPRQTHEEPGLKEEITFEPLGVVANISAWNYPYFVGINVFVPALLTGNTVLYKPSEFCSKTGLAIGELLHASGIPKKAFQVIEGGPESGSELLKQDIDAVFFTGSHTTGLKIKHAVSDRLIKVQLELGGKDPIYVCDDVDINVAAGSLADGAFYNNGQSCCAVERIYIHESIAEEFEKAFIKTVAGFKMGDPKDRDTYLGKLTRPAQKEILQAHVDDAAEKGASIHRGGQDLPNASEYFEPCVATNASNAMKIMRDESFGPIIGIARVKNDEEAISLMNDTHYGLTAGVFSRDESRAKKILGELNAGSVYWNCCDRVSPRLPWSGRKGSGLGWTLSEMGIETFLNPKAWHLKPDS